MKIRRDSPLEVILTILLGALTGAGFAIFIVVIANTAFGIAMGVVYAIPVGSAAGVVAAILFPKAMREYLHFLGSFW